MDTTESQQTVDCHHPTVYKLVASVRGEQESTEQRIERYLTGDRQSEATKAKYITVNRRLYALLATYDNTLRLDYLRSIGHNLDF